MMTTPLWCLVVVMFLPYLPAGLADYARARQFGSVDNRDPRGQSARLEGFGARAWAAQQNAWEALPFFAVAVLVAHLAGGDPGGSAVAAVVFLLSRLAYLAFYLADLSTLRSISFVVGAGACVRLVWLAAAA